MTKHIRLEMFSDARIALMREVKEHPDLLFSIAEVMALGDGSWEDQLGCIAAHCYIVVDGAYSEQDLDKLYDILVFELKTKRCISVVTTGNAKVILLDELEKIGDKKDEPETKH